MAPPGIISTIDDWMHPVSFHFCVLVDGTRTSFSDVSGIKTTLTVDEVVSGGDDSHRYYVPKTKTYDPLVLKRGMLKLEDPFFKWCKETMSLPLEKGRIKTKDIIVMLLDPLNVPLTTWTFKDAYPCSWTVEALNAQKNELAVESIELKFYSMEVNA